MYRCDRKGRSHGGVIAYIDDSYTCTELMNSSNQFCSSLCINILQLNIILVVIYRPPNSPLSSFNEMIMELQQKLKDMESPIPDIMFLGDFNFPNIIWPQGSIQKVGTLSEQSQASKLIEVTDDLFLKQIVTIPTRGQNILDLVFTSNSDLVYDLFSTPTVFSDHNMIEIRLNRGEEHYAQKETQTQEVPNLCKHNYHKANWTEINTSLSNVDWNSYLSGTDKLQKFFNKIEEICLSTIPIKETKTRRRQIPRERRILLRKRTKLRKKIQTISSADKMERILSKLQLIELELKENYDDDRITQEKKAVENIKKNPKFFYSYAQKFSKHRSTIGPLQKPNGDITNEASEMANILRQQYESVFSKPCESKKVLQPKQFFSEVDINKPSLVDIDFTVEDIERAIDKMSANSSAGPDGFSAMFIKNCKSNLSVPLYLIWRESLDTCTIPDVLKVANITPIHKGDSKSIPKNYRPVSLTSHIIKVFERVLREKLVNFLEKNELMNPSQHGFRSGRSCLSQLLAHHDKILENLEGGYNTDVIYLDFAKAFDKVDHGILSHKMRKLGIGGKVGLWIYEFLSKRTQKVVVNGAHSSASDVISSVPQGTVLGPILFLILISDIDENSTSTISSFADDTRVHRPIMSQTDIHTLQQDLETVYQWQRANNMLFNDKKFELIRYGTNQELKSKSGYTGPSGQKILEKNCLRDLGVQMGNSLKFTEHIDSVCQKARQYSGWVLRTFKSREISLMKTLWNSMVMPRIDYCSQLWAPVTKGQIAKLESLQRSYTAYIADTKHLNYWQRLRYLKMYSIERRFERYRIIYIWKIIERKVPNYGVEVYESTRHGRLCKIPPIIKKQERPLKHCVKPAYLCVEPNCSTPFQSISETEQTAVYCRSKRSLTATSVPYLMNLNYQDIPNKPRPNLIQSYIWPNCVEHLNRKSSRARRVESPTWPEHYSSN